MKNIVAKIITTLILVPTISLGAMMPPAAQGPSENSSKNNYFSSIPKELKQIIIPMALQGATEEAVITEIKKLRLVSKEFKTIIDGLLANGQLITYLAITFKKQAFDRHLRFRTHTEAIAKKFAGIPAAQAWLIKSKQLNRAEDVLIETVMYPGQDVARNLSLVREQMIENGTNVNMLNSLGNTLLFYAVDRARTPEHHDEYIHFITFLLQHGADPNLTGNAIEDTPLVRASRTYQPDSIKLLLKAGANPNSIDKEDGSTPLMQVIYWLPHIHNENMPILFNTIQTLLEYGAKVNIKDNYKHTALDSAIQRNAPQKLIDLLTKYGAKKGSQLP